MSGKVEYPRPYYKPLITTTEAFERRILHLKVHGEPQVGSKVPQPELELLVIRALDLGSSIRACPTVLVIPP